MLINDFVALHKLEPVTPPPAVIEEPDEGFACAEVDTPQEAKEAEPVEEEKDDDLEYSYEITDSQLDDLKDVYTLLMDDIMDGLLKGDVVMPIAMVKEIEVAVGDLHSIINEFEIFRPQDVGVPEIAVTLEDAFRQESDDDIRVPESSE